MKITKEQAMVVIKAVIDAFNEDADARAAMLCDQDKRKMLDSEGRCRNLMDVEAQFRAAKILGFRADHVAYGVSRMNRK